MLNTFSRGIVRSAVAVAMAVGMAASVYAMRVSPMIVEMTTTGSSSTARVEVQNLNAGRLPFETRITKLTFNEYGVPTETPADGDFLVFPPQGMLPQGARQVIRLQWVGTPDIPTSQAYYLSVNQLPIPAEPGAAPQSANVQVVYHMKALIVVAPTGARPDVSVTSVKQIDYQPEPVKAGDPLPPKVPGLEVTMKNNGRRHMMMSAAKWLIDGKAADGRPVRLTVTQEDLMRGIGSGYIAGGGAVRIYRFPIPQAFGPGPITVKFAQ